MPNFPLPEGSPRKKTVRTPPALSVRPGSSTKLPDDATTVYALPAADIRTCWCDICGQHKELRFRDCATGQNVGFCCVADLVFADHALNACQEMRRPTLNEAKEMQ